MPTTVLLAWTATLKTAGHLACCQRELSDRLGLDVRFQHVRYPRPGQSLYEGFELLDAETGHGVLRCRALEVTQTGRTLVLTPSEVEVAADRADKLVRLLVRRLARELPGEEDVALVPTRVTLETASGGQTYDDVEFRLESQADKSTATLRFRLPDAESGEPPRLTISRHRSDAGVNTEIVLDTLGTLVPLSIFRPWTQLDMVFGDDAAFRGRLKLAEVAGRRSCELKGALTDVDLERLIAERFPHHVIGHASLEIEHASIEAGKLTSAAGRLHSAEGDIGGSLLMAAAEFLNCQPGAAPLGRLPFATGKTYVYRDLGLDFDIGEEGLLLASTQVSGSLLLNEGGQSLLFAPPDERLPLVRLVRALVPDSLVQVPATKEAAGLVSWLPLPPVVRSPDDRRLPSPPLRVKNER
jgi:hypothetical protein